MTAPERPPRIVDLTAKREQQATLVLFQAHVREVERWHRRARHRETLYVGSLVGVLDSIYTCPHEVCQTLAAYLTAVER